MNPYANDHKMSNYDSKRGGGGPKVFSDKVKEETEKMKKQLQPGNLQEQQLTVKPKESGSNTGEYNSKRSNKMVKIRNESPNMA